MSSPKQITILGSTGSIGLSALDVVTQHPDRFKVIALGAGTNAEVMADQVRRFHPLRVCMATEEAAGKLSGILGKGGANGTEILYGPEGMKQLAASPEADSVLSAIVGAAGLEPTLAAIDAGKQICLANKETLVTAGELVLRRVTEKGVELLPVDSEHSAIFQALQGNDIKKVRRLILTASGGPFLHWTREKIAAAKPEEALKHPNWAMGRKITIDSAGLMNKGLEVIEARWLFDLPPEQIDVFIHPQSIVHSMVEYEDASVMAQLSVPDMKLPIAYALAYPERVTCGLDYLTDLIGGVEHRGHRARLAQRLEGEPQRRELLVIDVVEGEFLHGRCASRARCPRCSTPPMRLPCRRFWTARSLSTTSRASARR